MGLTASPAHFRPSGISLYQAIVAAGETANLQICNDPSALASYPGSGQTLDDLSGLGTDLYFGADGGSSTDEPSFNGPAGTLSRRVTNLEGDGGDFLRYTGGATLAAWMQTLHKTGAVFSWCALAMHTDFSPAPTMWSTRKLTTGPGVDILFTAAGKARFSILNDAAASTGWNADAGMSADAWHMVGGTINGAASFLWRDGAYDQVAASDTFDVTGASYGSGNTDKFDVMGSSAGSGDACFANGSQFGGLAVWQPRALTKAGLDKILAALGGVGGI